MADEPTPKADYAGTLPDVTKPMSAVPMHLGVVPPPQNSSQQFDSQEATLLKELIAGVNEIRDIVKANFASANAGKVDPPNVPT